MARRKKIAPARRRSTAAEKRAEAFDRRVEAYVKASKLKDPSVARETARSIVIAEGHRDALALELERKGELSDDKHRALNALHSNLHRMRRAAGMLELREDEDEASSVGMGLSAAPVEEEDAHVAVLNGGADALAS